jgi:hypothetical protein
MLPQQFPNIAPAAFGIAADALSVLIEGIPRLNHARCSSSPQE